MEKAIFAAGCFWGVEEAFRQVRGVKNTTAGYTGGDFLNPAYEDVCSGMTGHAEAVLVEYDPLLVSYNELLEIFWAIHDPTTVDRQGPDIGSQYRSAIFYFNHEQERLAKESKKEMDGSGRYRRRIVTEIKPAGRFYKAEEYHQKYLEKRGLTGCHL